MPSIRDMYNSAREKIVGQTEEDFSEADFEDESDDFGGFENDAVRPMGRQNPRAEREGASRNPREHRSAGLDSLFTPTTKKNRVMAEASDETQVIEPVKAEAPKPSAPPSMTAPQEKVVVSRKVRQVAVINPDSYEEAEIVTNVLKEGNVVLLDLRTTNMQLMTRFLDFSFGAASALGAKVDLLQDKIYVITVGPAITALEIERVRKDGLL